MKNHLHGRWDYLAILGLLFPAGFVLFFYMYLGIFNRLLADDYCSVYYGRRLGLLRSVWYWYITWHGGFSASAADWFLSFIGPGLLQIMTIITVIVWVLLVIWIWRRIFFRGDITRRSFYYSLIAGIILIYATLVISPDISQSLFWWGGVRGYFLPLIFATLYLYIYLLFNASNWRTWQLAVWYLASFSLVFFTGGFAEVFTPVQLVIFLGVILWIWLVRKSTFRDSHFRFLLAGLAGAFLSLVVMVAAPGNYLRQEYFPDPPNLFTVSSISINGYLIFLKSIFGSLALASCVVGSMLTAVWVGITYCADTKPTSQKPLHAIMALVIGFVLAFGRFPSAAYGVSEPPPLRTQIIPSYLLMIGVLIGGYLFGEWLGNQGYRSNLIRAVLLVPACMFILVSSWGEISFLASIHQDLVSFAQKWDQVDTKIKIAAQSGEEEVYIPSMENWAGLGYPSHRLKYWPNVCFRQYYGIKIFAPPQGD